MNEVSWKCQAKKVACCFVSNIPVRCSTPTELWTKAQRLPRSFALAGLPWENHQTRKSSPLSEGERKKERGCPKSCSSPSSVALINTAAFSPVGLCAARRTSCLNSFWSRRNTPLVCNDSELYSSDQPAPHSIFGTSTFLNSALRIQSTLPLHLPAPNCSICPEKDAKPNRLNHQHAQS